MMSLMKMNEYVAIQEKICEKNDYIAPRLYPLRCRMARKYLVMENSGTGVIGWRI